MNRSTGKAINGMRTLEKMIYLKRNIWKKGNKMKQVFYATLLKIKWLFQGFFDFQSDFF